MNQTMDILLGIDPAPFWTNLFLYSYEKDNLSFLISSKKVKAKLYICTKLFIDSFCAINDGGKVFFGNMMIFDGFIPKSKELLNHMESQGSKSIPTKHTLRKLFYHINNIFSTFPFLVMC